MSKITFIFSAVLIIVLASCGSSNKQETPSDDSLKNDTTTTIICDTVVNSNGDTVVSEKKLSEVPCVELYLFHATHRCPTCITIEECVDAALKTSFQTQVQSGVVRKINIDADDEKNAKICEKYEAFGTALFVTRIFQGRETKTDLTAQAFKMVRNKPEDLQKLITEQIQNDLK
jgi:transglutaminase/protease-like cytokinesis protein 3